MFGLSIGTAIFCFLRFCPFPLGEYKGAAIVLEAKENYAVLLFKGRKVLLFERGTLLEEGDILRIEGQVGPLQIEHFEGRFDFESYLVKKGVKGEISLLQKQTLFARPIRLREIELRFLSHFDETTGGLLDSFLFNRKDYQNSILKKANELNVLFLFSSSGVYLSLLKRFLGFLFSYARNEKAKAICPFLILLLFSSFSLSKIGVWRVLFLSFLDFERAIRKKGKISFYKKIALSGFLCFLIDPFSILQESFQIGFFLSLYLSLQKARMGVLKTKGSKRIRSFASAFLFLLPLYMSENSFHLLSPFYSLLLPPVTLPYITLGYCSFFGVPIYGSLRAYGSFLLSFLSVLGKISVEIPLFGRFEWLRSGYYSLLFLSLYLNDIGLTELRKTVTLVPLCFCLFNALPITNHLSYQVSFIDVSQGDSIFVRAGEKALLVDTGGTNRFDIAHEVLLPFLRREKITHLDYLILTHDDFDHSGGKESLVSSFSVSKVLTSKESFPLSFQGIEIYNLNPLEGTNNDKNKGSLVLSFNLEGQKFLLMGDATEETEKAILQKGITEHDVLKVGHHGSKTSSCPAFLDALKPKEAIISCGVHNKYGHPDKEVLERLKERDIRIRRTDLEGTITYKGWLKRGFSLF